MNSVVEGNNLAWDRDNNIVKILDTLPGFWLGNVTCFLFGARGHYILIEWIHHPGWADRER